MRPHGDESDKSLERGRLILDRREMLQQSLKGLVRSIPTVLGLAGGLGRAITDEGEPTTPRPAACFPRPGKEHEAAKPPEERREKE